MEYNCPDPLICGINCASDTQIEKNNTKIIIFNNYSPYYIRIKSCLFDIHDTKLKKFSIIEQKSCRDNNAGTIAASAIAAEKESDTTSSLLAAAAASAEIDEYYSCSRWIPPKSFIPVALPLNITYIEIEKCKKLYIYENGTRTDIEPYNSWSQKVKVTYLNYETEDILNDSEEENTASSSPPSSSFNKESKVVEIQYKCFLNDLNNPTKRIYGNSLSFTSSFTLGLEKRVENAPEAMCNNDEECLGSFCDKQFIPSICSPKNIYQVYGESKDYLTLQ